MAELTILGKAATRNEAASVFYWVVERFPFRVSVDEFKEIPPAEGEDPVVSPFEGMAIGWNVRLMGTASNGVSTAMEIVKETENPPITLEEAATKIEDVCRSLMTDMNYWIG
jgi:hypothetical protein